MGEERRQKKAKRAELNKTCIYVGNAPFLAREEDYRKFFGKCGKINEVRIPMEYGSRDWTHGYAWIQFADVKSYKNGLKMNEMKMKDRPLVINGAADIPKSKPKKSTKPTKVTKPS